MRQFPQSQLLSAVQARGELSEAHIDALARQIADLAHEACVIAGALAELLLASDQDPPA